MIKTYELLITNEETESATFASSITRYLMERAVKYANKLGLDNIKVIDVDYDKDKDGWKITISGEKQI